MSKNKDLRRARHAPPPVLRQAVNAVESVSPMPQPKRAGFSITITWNPAAPEQANYNILANEDGVVRDGDILNALQITRDDVLSKTVMVLVRQQMQAAGAQDHAAEGK